MTWLGDPAYLATLGAAVFITLLVDWWLLRTGRIERRHHRVPHYKLRAASARGKIAARIAASLTVPITRPELRAAGHLQGDVPAATRRGSAATTTSVEPQPASVRRETSPGAGPVLQAGDSRLDRDSVDLPARRESQPAPRSSGAASLGAGPQSRIAVDAPDFGGGPGPKLPADVATPDTASTGAGAASYGPAAPATRSAT